MKPGDFLQNVERFWAKVDRTGGPDACWLWTNELNGMGYGRFLFWHEGKRSRVLAHRLSLTLSGVALNSGDVVMHACDTPACVNPAHLSVGTQLENIRDAIAKGRMDMSGLELGRGVAQARTKAGAA